MKEKLLNAFFMTLIFLFFAFIAKFCFSYYMEDQKELKYSCQYGKYCYNAEQAVKRCKLKPKKHDSSLDCINYLSK